MIIAEAITLSVTLQFSGMTPEDSKEVLCKNNDEYTLALSFDHIQNLPMINVLGQKLFYIEQLLLNVFSINDLKTIHQMEFV